MQKKIESIKFNMTQSMALQLLQFNKLKKELNYLYNVYKSNNDKKVLIKILDLEDEMNKLKTSFILEFRTNNKKQIEEYMKFQQE